MGWFVEVLRWAGPLLFVGMQGSSLYTAWLILQQHGTGKLSPIPFGSLFANCFIWSLYGRMEFNPSVLYPNMSGLFVATFCLVIFHQYCGGIKPWNMYLVLGGISFLCIYLSRSGDSQTIGLIGCFLSVAVSGSPLAVVQTVIRDKSTASMPFATSVVTWFNTISWTLFGYLVAHDPLIYMPNILGLALATMQMGLFVVYGLPAKKVEIDESKYPKLTRLPEIV
jgi:solute carrier family 50 (sugar transporter)